MLLLEGSCEVGLFRHLSHHLFRSPYYPKSVGYEGHLFLENVQNLIQISVIERNIKKNSFVSEIIVSELVALNCLS